jgi:hypothetical protein
LAEYEGVQRIVVTVDVIDEPGNDTTGVDALDTSAHPRRTST